MIDKNILSERESKNLIIEMIISMPNSQVYRYIDLFLTRLYVKGYQVCKKTDKKET